MTICKFQGFPASRPTHEVPVLNGDEEPNGVFSFLETGAG
jgi:hypothetical protein